MTLAWKAAGNVLDKVCGVITFTMTHVVSSLQMDVGPTFAASNQIYETDLDSGGKHDEKSSA